MLRDAFFNKSYSVPQIRTDYKDNPKFLDWILKYDKNNHQSQMKENMKPFEILFFDVGRNNEECKWLDKDHLKNGTRY